MSPRLLRHDFPPEQRKGVNLIPEESASEEKKVGKGIQACSRAVFLIGINVKDQRLTISRDLL